MNRSYKIAKITLNFNRKKGVQRADLGMMGEPYEITRGYLSRGFKSEDRFSDSIAATRGLSLAFADQYSSEC